MLSLPLITPRDSHELWFGSSQPYRSSSSQINQPPGDLIQAQTRRNATHTLNGRLTGTQGSSLSSLQLEERALRARKQNIASFGYSWIKPAGCTKTMLGMKEEEAEREEALAAAAAEMAAAAAAADPTMDDDLQQDGDGQDEGMERDLDDDIPDADTEGLVEEGEEGLEEEDVGDEEGYMERDLDDDIPEAFPDDDDDGDDDEIEEGEEDFDNQPDLDDDIPEAGDEDDLSEGMVRDLDDDIPEAAESLSEQDEWQHTDTDAEFDDEDDENEENFASDPFTNNLRASTISNRGLPPPPPPPLRRERETPAQRRFLQRWSGGGDAFDSSSMMLDEEDLHASIASHASRRSGFGRFPRRRGGPRDSFD